jgi:hypothetical protein
MARVEIAGGELTVHVEGLDKVLALRSQLHIPLAHVKGVSTDVAQIADRFKRFAAFRVGTNVPGLVRAGTFYEEGGWVFWDVHDLNSALLIELSHEHFRQLVIQVPDPEAAAASISRRWRPARPADPSGRTGASPPAARPPPRPPSSRSRPPR